MVVYNRQTMADRLGDDEEIHRLVLTVFLEDAPGQLQGLRDALAGGDQEEIRHKAHAIKGAAANVSAENMQETALAMEVAAREGQLEGMEEKLRTLEAEYQRFVAEMADQGLTVMAG